MEGNSLMQKLQGSSLWSRHNNAPLVLMLCLPLVPHHPTVIEYSIATKLVPLAFSPISVAAALMLLLVLGERQARHSACVSLLVASTALLLIGCDIAYTAWRLGLRLPFPKNIVEGVDVFAQTLFLTASALLTRCSSSGEEAQNAPVDARVIGALVPYLFGALFPQLLSVLAMASSRCLASQIGICLLSGALGSRLLVARQAEAIGEPLSAQASLLLGLLFSSAFDELMLTALCSARLNIDSQDPAAVRNAATWCVIAMAGYVLIVLLFGLALCMLSKRQPASPAEAQSKHPAYIRRLGSLSPRQQQVLLMSIEGRSDAEIAQVLGLTPGTVGNHRRRGLERLGISEMGELIVAENDAGGLATRRKRGATAGAAYALRFVGAVALCHSTLMRPPSDIAYFLSILIGVVLSASCVAALLWKGCEGTCPVNPASSVLGPFFWFTLSAAAALCWAFASLATTLAIGAALVAFLCMRILRPISGKACTKSPQTPRSDEGETHFVGRVEPSLSLASAAAGVILAAHASQILGTLPSEASRCHLAARILIGVAVVAILASSMPSRRAAGKNEERADDGSTHDAFFRTMGLSELETQVAILSAQGYTRPQICEMLHIATGTVNSCRAAVYRKLGVHSKEELAALVSERAGQSCR